jgi:hypothetical protein
VSERVHAHFARSGAARVAPTRPAWPTGLTARPLHGTKVFLDRQAEQRHGVRGHTDWRLPTSGGVGLPTGDPPELESIVDPSVAGCDTFLQPCIDPIFGPTAAQGPYRSASPAPTMPTHRAWFVDFDDGRVLAITGGIGLSVRAVRGGP